MGPIVLSLIVVTGRIFIIPRVRSAVSVRPVSIVPAILACVSSAGRHIISITNFLQSGGCTGDPGDALQLAHNVPEPRESRRRGELGAPGTAFR